MKRNECENIRIRRRTGCSRWAKYWWWGEQEVAWVSWGRGPRLLSGQQMEKCGTSLYSIAGHHARPLAPFSNNSMIWWTDRIWLMNDHAYTNHKLTFHSSLSSLNLIEGDWGEKCKGVSREYNVSSVFCRFFEGWSIGSNNL